MVRLLGAPAGRQGPRREHPAGLWGGVELVMIGPRSWWKSDPGGEGRRSLEGLAGAAGSSGLHLPPRAVGSPRRVVGIRRPVFPGRMEGQKSRRVIERLRRGWEDDGGAVTCAEKRRLVGEAMVPGRGDGPASRLGESGGEGEEGPCRIA